MHSSLGEPRTTLSADHVPGPLEEIPCPALGSPIPRLLRPPPPRLPPWVRGPLMRRGAGRPGRVPCFAVQAGTEGGTGASERRGPGVGGVLGMRKRQWLQDRFRRQK